MRRVLLWLIAVSLVGPLAVAASRREPQATPASATFRPSTPGSDWPVVHGEPGGGRYSTLRAINRSTVGQLRVAWTYHTGDADPAAFTTIECTPLVVEGVMFITSARAKVTALDAATGTPFWTFDPWPPTSDAGPLPRVAAGVNRGVAYWASGTDRRVLLGTADGRLIALDAARGTPVASFGKAGTVVLADTLPDAFAGRMIGTTSPPAVFEDLAIVGVSVGEGPEPAAAGDVLAFDARTGALRWRFRTVPHPGEHGHDTWRGDSWRGRGGANAWSGVTIDQARGLAFVSTGSATFDFFGGDRHGDNLFANSTIALDARTGQRRWHFQTIKHDIWDYDLPTPPVLARVEHAGARVDVVAQVTKTGFVFVFDRDTGRPIFDVVDRRVPRSDVPGEQASATQPIPSSPPPFVRQGFREADVFGTTPEAKAEALDRFRAMRHGELFLPPSLQGTLSLPGTLGGATWSGASFDPTTGHLYVNANELASMLKLIPAKPGSSQPYALESYAKFVDRDGYPAITPPWGTVSSIDLGRGRIAWQVPLGERAELVARGLRHTGTPNFGGTIVTAGGLVFIGGSTDEQLHAFDAQTGAQLWAHPLGAGGYATPATYAVDGRQFVVIAAGGGGKARTRSGDAFVAFAIGEGKR